MVAAWTAVGTASAQQPATVAAPTYYRAQAPVTPQPTTYTVAQPKYAATTAVAAAPAQPRSYATGDPYGFTNWLNTTRAQYGLGAVGYDPNLSGWAAQNNAQQQSRGMGHYVMGSARRQNSATGNYAQIGAMWMASPPHRAALLDPTIRWIGIAGLGAYWTFNAN